MLASPHEDWIDNRSQDEVPSEVRGLPFGTFQILRRSIVKGQPQCRYVGTTPYVWGWWLRTAAGMQYDGGVWVISKDMHPPVSS